jgi:putative inorganic carbon (hco3(-)) transporter
VAASLALMAWGRGQRGWPWALAWSALAAVIAAGLLASWSRGAWLGALAGLAVVGIARSRRAALLAGAAGVTLALLLLAGSLSPAWVPEPVAARLRDVPAYFGGGDILAQEVNDDNFAVVERLAHWAAALRMFERAPWLGVGAGNYAAVYSQVRLPRWEEPLGHAHNIYLNVLAESGLIGLAAFAALWVSVFVHVWRGRRQGLAVGDPLAVALAVGVLGVLAHLAVHSLVDNLFVQSMYVQVAVWIALVATLRAGAPVRPEG